MEVTEELPPKPLTVAWFRQFSNQGWVDLSELQHIEEDALDAKDGDPGVNSAVARLRVRGLRCGCRPLEIYFVTKRAAVGPVLDIALLQRWYQRERNFYAEVAPTLSCSSSSTPSDYDRPYHASRLRFPRCASLGPSSFGPGAEGFLLVLEHLGAPAWRAAEPGSGCSQAEAVAAVRSLAWLHARFLAEPDRLSACGWLPRTPVHVEFAEQIQAYYAGAWEQVRVELPGHLLPPAGIAMCNNLCSSYALLLRRLARPPCTLVHGDFRLENLRFGTEDGAEQLVAAFDWQFCCAARGAYDLAYFICLALPPHLRRELEQDLRQEYGNVLREVAASRAEPALAELDDDMCASVLLIMASFVMGTATAPATAKEMHHRSLGWLMAAAIDCNAARLLLAPNRNLGTLAASPLLA